MPRNCIDRDGIPTGCRLHKTMRRSTCCLQKIIAVLEKQTGSNMKKIWQTLALLLFLVGLPLGSWYYLREGYNFRKALFDDLRDLGQVPPIGLTDSRDSLIRLDEIADKVLILSELGSEDTLSMRLLHGVADQFAPSGAVVFALFGKDSLATAALQHYFRDQTETHPDMFLFFSGGEELLQALPLPERNGRHAALADTAHTLRRVYDLHAAGEVNRLVEQLTIVIPGKRTAKPTLKRSAEK